MGQILLGLLLIAGGSAMLYWGQQLVRDGYDKQKTPPEKHASAALATPLSIGSVHGNVVINNGPAKNSVTNQEMADESFARRDDASFRSQTSLPPKATTSPDLTAQLAVPLRINGGLNQASFGLDGKIYLTGSFTAVGEELHIGLARLNRDGTLDSTFRAEADGGGFAFAFLKDGGFLLNGWAGVTKYSRSGLKDAIFPMITGSRTLIVGSDDSIWTSSGKYSPAGVRLLTFPHTFEALAMVIQPDGRILLGGLGGRLVRLNPDGAIDLSFTAPAGIHGGNIHGIGVQPDGRIVITGGAFALLPNVFRLNSDGTIDKSFKSATDTYGPVLCLEDGTILISSGNNGTGITRDHDGRLICAGTLVRLLPNGAMHERQPFLDPQFANVSGFGVYLPI